MSESSLDVFQLLLQLSDTMLDLNNQLSAKQNASRLLKSSSLLYQQQQQQQQQQQHNPATSNDFNTSANTDTDYYDYEIDPSLSHCQPPGETTANKVVTTTTTRCQYDNIAAASPGKKPAHTSNNSIENFINKTIFMNSTCTRPPHASATASSQIGHGVSNIINQLNINHSNSGGKRAAQPVGPMSPPKSRPPLVVIPPTDDIHRHHHHHHHNQPLLSSNSMASKSSGGGHHKTPTPTDLSNASSVTKFVDSLFNTSSSRIESSNLGGGGGGGFSRASSLLKQQSPSSSSSSQTNNNHQQKIG